MKLSNLISTALVATSLLLIAPSANASEGQHLIQLARKNSPCATAIVVKTATGALVENKEISANDEMVVDTEYLYAKYCTGNAARHLNFENISNAAVREISRTNGVGRAIEGLNDLHNDAVKNGYELIGDYLESIL